MKFIKSYLVEIISFVSCIVSLWGVLVYDFKCDIIGLPYDYHEGWDTFVKSISYSILTGWLIFFLTAKLPYWLEKNKNQKYITLSLKKLNWEFSTILNKCISDSENYVIYEQINVDNEVVSIISSKCLPLVLQKTSFKKEGTNYGSTFQEIKFFIYKLYIILNNLNHTYHRFLTPIQIICIQQIIDNIQEINWHKVISNSEISIEDIRQYIMQIINPLQKSIGINCGWKSLSDLITYATIK